MFAWLTIFKSSTVIAVFILELAERTAYYGTVFSISTYATLLLKIDAGAAFAITNAVFALSPLSAFAAGIFADTWFHRVEVLIVAASCYVFALGLIALSANPAFFGDEDFATPTVAPFLLFFPGLALLSIGYGAFKVCTSPLVVEGALSIAKKEMNFVVSGFDGVVTDDYNKTSEIGGNNNNNVISDTSLAQQQQKPDYETLSGPTSQERIVGNTDNNDDDEPKNTIVDDDDDRDNDDIADRNFVEDDDVDSDGIEEEDNVDDLDELIDDEDDVENSNNDKNKDVTNQKCESSSSANSSSNKDDNERTVNNSSKTVEKKKRTELGEVVYDSSIGENFDINNSKKQNSANNSNKKIEYDRETLLALTCTVYAAVINLGSLFGFTFIPSLRLAGNINYYSGTLAEDGEKKPAGFVYSWSACFGLAFLALTIFILMAKFSRRFVRPRGFASSWILSASAAGTHQQNQNAATAAHHATGLICGGGDVGDLLNNNNNNNDRRGKSFASTTGSGIKSSMMKQQHQHPTEFVAHLGEAVGLSCLVGCCCPSLGSAPSDDNHHHHQNEDYLDHESNKNGGTSNNANNNAAGVAKSSTLDDRLLTPSATSPETIHKNLKNKKHVKSLVGVLKIFLILPIYWFTTALASTSFQVQAFCAVLPKWLSVDMLNTVSTVAFLVSLPIIQAMTAKLLARLHRNGSLCFGFFQSVLTLRLVCGFCMAAFGMINAGFIQIQIDKVATLTEDGDCILKNKDAIAADVLPGVGQVSFTFVLAGIASAFSDPAALEAAFDLAPHDMRSTVMSLYLLESSLSGFIGLGLTPAFSNPKSFTVSFFAVAIVLIAVTIIWAIWVRNVHKQTAPASVVAAARKERRKMKLTFSEGGGDANNGDNNKSTGDANVKNNNEKEEARKSLLDPEP